MNPASEASLHGLEPGDDLSRVLRELYADARTVRGWMPSDHPARKAGESLAALLARLHANGYTYYSLDKMMGADRVAQRRMARHGYGSPAPSAERERYKGGDPDHRDPGGRRPLDITGQRVHRLTAIEPTGEIGAGGATWRFRCDCGGERVAVVKDFRAGRVKQCKACVARDRRERAARD